MPVNLSIKNAPDELVARLKRRAIRNHRSMQGEVIAILDTATSEGEVMSAEQVERILADIRSIGHPNAAESTAIIREDRDRDRG
jgi:plasmid stability protein